MQKIVPWILGLALAVPPAIAQTPAQAVLPPGKPAGVKKAIYLDPKGTVFAGIALVTLAAGIYLAGHASSTTSTSP